MRSLLAEQLLYYLSARWTVLDASALYTIAMCCKVGGTVSGKAAVLELCAAVRAVSVSVKVQ